ncbi:uncharacterized protein LOC107883937 [Acyrthosiphon pisum]|uniref:Uncharacterized protein n=1 Tax=Acyrthosiphon pisum TaxID=7029 RepID=A0A8R2H519_ACYPI|nr:uncharacterized protein LOC107883937 [Acyrthosiphon pisum]|eukprot:XP_016660461.1 PREDICTED: uncharacterized protein LOC107883937 [Acyrthosiphon pisum]
MYATAMSFAVRCVAIFILLTFRKVRDILRQWYEDKLALEVSTPRFDLDFRCPSEDTADDVVQLPKQTLRANPARRPSPRKWIVRGLQCLHHHGSMWARPCS